MELLDKFNDRKMKNRDYSRREYFELNEKSTLHDLPETEFTIKYTKDCTVGSNYHIYINTHQYSVPYEYVRKSVSVVYDRKYVTDRKMSTANARIIKSIMLNRSYLLPKRDTDEQAQPLHDNLRGKEAFLN